MSLFAVLGFVRAYISCVCNIYPKSLHTPAVNAYVVYTCPGRGIPLDMSVHPIKRALYQDYSPESA